MTGVRPPASGRLHWPIGHQSENRCVYCCGFSELPEYRQSSTCVLHQPQALSIVFTSSRVLCDMASLSNSLTCVLMAFIVPIASGFSNVACRSARMLHSQYHSFIGLAACNPITFSTRSHHLAVYLVGNDSRLNVSTFPWALNSFSFLIRCCFVIVIDFNCWLRGPWGSSGCK